MSSVSEKLKDQYLKWGMKEAALEVYLKIGGSKKMIKAMALGAHLLYEDWWDEIFIVLIMPDKIFVEDRTMRYRIVYSPREKNFSVNEIIFAYTDDKGRRVQISINGVWKLNITKAENVVVTLPSWNMAVKLVTSFLSSLLPWWWWLKSVKGYQELWIPLLFGWPTKPSISIVGVFPKMVKGYLSPQLLSFVLNKSVSSKKITFNYEEMGWTVCLSRYHNK